MRDERPLHAVLGKGYVPGKRFADRSETHARHLMGRSEAPQPLSPLNKIVG